MNYKRYRIDVSRVAPTKRFEIGQELHRISPNVTYEYSPLRNKVYYEALLVSPIELNPLNLPYVCKITEYQLPCV